MLGFGGDDGCWWLDTRVGATVWRAVGSLQTTDDCTKGCILWTQDKPTHMLHVHAGRQVHHGPVARSNHAAWTSFDRGMGCRDDTLHSRCSAATDSLKQSSFISTFALEPRTAQFQAAADQAGVHAGVVCTNIQFLCNAWVAVATVVAHHSGGERSSAAASGSPPIGTRNTPPRCCLPRLRYHHNCDCRTRRGPSARWR